MEDKWKELLRIKQTIQKYEENLKKLKGEHARMQFAIRSEAQTISRLKQELMDKIH